MCTWAIAFTSGLVQSSHQIGNWYLTVLPSFSMFCLLINPANTSIMYCASLAENCMTNVYHRHSHCWVLIYVSLRKGQLSRQTAVNLHSGPQFTHCSCITNWMGRAMGFWLHRGVYLEVACSDQHGKTVWLCQLVFGLGVKMAICNHHIFLLVWAKDHQSL